MNGAGWRTRTPRPWLTGRSGRTWPPARSWKPRRAGLPCVDTWNVCSPSAPWGLPIPGRVATSTCAARETRTTPCSISATVPRRPRNASSWTPTSGASREPRPWTGTTRTARAVAWPSGGPQEETNSAGFGSWMWTPAPRSKRSPTPGPAAWRGFLTAAASTIPATRPRTAFPRATPSIIGASSSTPWEPTPASMNWSSGKAGNPRTGPACTSPRRGDTCWSA